MKTRLGDHHTRNDHRFGAKHFYSNRTARIVFRIHANFDPGRGATVLFCAQPRSTQTRTQPGGFGEEGVGAPAGAQDRDPHLV